ncbi:MAG TPA: hypothetical protein VGQ27_00750 [Steroidobacteraceae bacterium]|jgi:hypothetical protein|nr:hypothetical protein [Steroidobacteraceae bacterium]
MIDITAGITRVTASTDSIEAPFSPDADSARAPSRHAPTGVRITVEFSREAALQPDQPVRVRYELGDGGAVREVIGIAAHSWIDVRWGSAVVHHYRLSHWIAAHEVAPKIQGNVR